ncbi:hypothetical protein C8Q80DRAFT_1130259 [Daedaleopsis nitida]|nr:hypothetical protein C8Q80DRAFT_1130259 [Daedaleopsis nitida]
MRHHATLTAHLPSLSLASVFQAAAGRAWARTRPTRAYHRTSLRGDGLSNTPRPVRGDHDVRGGTGEPSSSTIPSCNTVSNHLSEVRGRVITPMLPSPTMAAESSLSAAVSDPDTRHAPRCTPSRAPVGHRAVFIAPPLGNRQASGRVSPDHPTYESEPPWEEIRESVPQSALPCVTFFQPETPPPPLLPPPTTHDDLLHHITQGITARPPASLSQVVSYHAAHPSLHTTASFNMVVRYAVRHASYGTVVDLLARMVRERVAGDEETRVLRVRSMVRAGYWTRAWEEELAESRKAGEGMPLPVWLEFFGTVKRGAILGRRASYGTALAGRPKALEAPDPTTAAARLHAVVQHAPIVTPDEWQQVPARVTYALVRSLVEQERRTEALELTRTYFQSLPEEMDKDWRRECLAIIHLHLKPGRVCNLSEHFRALGTLFGLLGMHDSFAASSTTLFFVLRTLRRTKRCGERADRVVGSFERRWGAGVVDDRVRRRWASLWVKQGRPERAEAIAEVQHAEDARRGAEDVMGERSSKGRGRRLRWLELHRSPREGQEGWRWRRLRRRMRMRKGEEAGTPS